MKRRALYLVLGMAVGWDLARHQWSDLILVPVAIALVEWRRS